MEIQIWGVMKIQSLIKFTHSTLSFRKRQVPNVPQSTKMLIE